MFHKFLSFDIGCTCAYINETLYSSVKNKKDGNSIFIVRYFYIFSTAAVWGGWVVTPLKVLVAQSCPTLCNPMDYSPPGSSVHGILQARILEWVVIPFSRGSFQPRNQTQGLPHYRQILYHLRHQGSHQYSGMSNGKWFPTVAFWRILHYCFHGFWNSGNSAVNCPII